MARRPPPSRGRQGHGSIPPFSLQCCATSMRRGWRVRMRGRRAGSKRCRRHRSPASRLRLHHRGPSQPFSIAWPAAQAWPRPRSSRCSRRGGETSGRVPRPPTHCARGAAATRSPMSSTATSTTRTSAPTAARSAPSRRAGTVSSHREKPYDLALEEIADAHPRGLGARRHRGLPAGRHPAGLHGRDLSRHRRRA